MPLEHLLVKPVGSACNLACSYCFYRPVEQYLPTGEPMSEEILEKMVGDFLAGRPQIAAFGWQGGEPTLAGLDFFKKVVSTQARLGVRGQRVGNALQTNGQVIDDEWARFLYEWRFLVGLSIDGPEPVHNSRRGKSWRRAMDAAEHLRKRDVAFNVLVVLTEESAALGGELYRWFLSEGFNDVQFIPCIEPASLGSPADWNPRVADFSVSPRTLGRFMVETWQEWRQSGYPRGASERTFNAMIARFAGVDPGLCTFAPDCASYLVVEREGGVYPCDFFVRKEWRLGRVADGLHELAASPLRRKFGGLKGAAREACGDCQWWDLCHGGCPKDRFQVGGFDQPSPFCEAYKHFFSETVDWFREEAARRSEQCRIEEQAAREAARARRLRPASAMPGRNDPCPCGSGRKFKHCCGRR
jgi:uncharacterized protein